MDGFDVTAVLAGESKPPQKRTQMMKYTHSAPLPSVRHGLDTKHTFT